SDEDGGNQRTSQRAKRAIKQSAMGEQLQNASGQVERSRGSSLPWFVARYGIRLVRHRLPFSRRRRGFPLGLWARLLRGGLGRFSCGGLGLFSRDGATRRRGIRRLRAGGAFVRAR